jgi:hypothetical protein
VIYKVSPDSLDVTVLTIRTILCLARLTGIEPVCGVAVPFHPQYPIQRINKSRACRLNYNLPVSRRTLKLGGLSRTQTTQHLLMKEIGFPITLKPKFGVGLLARFRTYQSWTYGDVSVTYHTRRYLGSLVEPDGIEPLT